MKTYPIENTCYLSIADLHYIEDFVTEFTSESVIAQALEGVREEDLEQAYNSFLLDAFVKESILRGRKTHEDFETLIADSE